MVLFETSSKNARDDLAVFDGGDSVVDHADRVEFKRVRCRQIGEQLVESWIPRGSEVQRDPER